MKKNKAMPNRHIPTNEMETIQAELLELSFKTFQQPHNSRSGTPFNPPFDDFATLNATHLHDLDRIGTDNCNNKNQKENIIQGEKSSLSTENLNPIKLVKEQLPKNETESITSCVYVAPHPNPFINTNSFDSMLDDAEKINAQSLEDLITNSDEFYGANYLSEEVLYHEENTIQEQEGESSLSRNPFNTLPEDAEKINAQPHDDLVINFDELYGITYSREKVVDTDETEVDNEEKVVNGSDDDEDDKKEDKYKGKEEENMTEEESLLSTENLNQNKTIKKQASSIEPWINPFISTNSFDRICVAKSDKFHGTNYSTEKVLDSDEGKIVDGNIEGVNDDEENEVVDDDEKEGKADDDGDDDVEDDETDGSDANDYYNEEDYDDDEYEDDTDVEVDEGYDDGTGEDSCSDFDFDFRIYDNLVETDEYE